MKINIILPIFVLLWFTGCAGSKKTTAKYNYYHGLIFFDIQAKGGDTLFALFDTGAEISAIDIETSNKLKLPTIDSTQVTGSNATIEVEVVSLTDLKLKKYFVDSISPTKRELTHSLTPENRKLDIILGYDFFKNSIVEIDFTRNELNVLKDPTELNYKNFIPFSLDHNIPRFSGMVNGKIKIEFRLDTGASLFETEDIYINITSNDWNNIKTEYPSLKPASFLSASGINNEKIKLPVVKLKQVQVGEFVFDNPYVIIQPEQGYFASSEAVGFISNNLLSKFNRIAIDYVNKRLYFSNLRKDQ